MARFIQISLFTLIGAGGLVMAACSGSNDPVGPSATGGTASTTTGGSSTTTGGSTSPTTGGSSTTTTGGTSAGTDMFTPLCGALTTAAGVAPTKAGACTDSDPQLCYKTCGPQSIGFKSETCSAGAYVEQSGCSFKSDLDASCYKIPTTLDPSCPATAPKAGTECTVAVCTPCSGPDTTYLDSQDAPKTGFCVCPEPSSTTGVSKWSCASLTSWPCPQGKGCT